MTAMLRHDLSSITPLVAAVLILLAASIPVPAAAAEPSFDCRTARTAREVATCHDAKLAAADRDMAAAWQDALAHLDSATAKALREDQRQFLSGLDAGFDNEVWGKSGPPDDGAEMRKEIGELRRGPDDQTPGNYSLRVLDGEFADRIAFLRNLTPADRAAPFAGLWKNENAELLIEPADAGFYRVSFGTKAFGYTKYQCHFIGAFTASPDGLVAPVAHNIDSEINQDIRDNLHIARVGGTLTIDDDVPHQGNGVDPYYICPRVPSLTGPLFHTSLSAGQMHQLNPDKD